MNSRAFKQKGAALIVVVMLTAVASLLVFTALNNTVSQGRMSGNFQKAVNAEYQADKAIFHAYHKLNHAVSENPKISDAELAEYVLISKAPSLSDRYFTASAISPAEGMLRIESKGYFYHDSETSNQVILKRFYGSPESGKPSGPESPFGFGLVGCAGVTLAGSGSIGSFHSKGETYNNPVLVKTYQNGDVTIPGGTAIVGDVIASGKVTFSGSGNVSGNVHANGGVEITGGTSIGGNVITSGFYRQTSGYVGGNISADGDVIIEAWNAHSIGGDVSTMGNYTHTGTNVGGQVRANGNVVVSQGTINNGVQAGGNFTLTAWNAAAIKGPVLAVNNISVTSSNNCSNPPISAFNTMLYGGTATVPTGLRACLPTKKTPPPAFTTVTPVARVPQETDVTTDGNVIACDSLNIAAVSNAIKATMPTNAKALTIGWWPETPYRLFPTNTLMNNLAAANDYQPVEATVFGKPRMVHFFKSKLEIQSPVSAPGGMVIEGGNVVIFVDGDFILSGSAELRILEGSSLTLFVTGKVNLGNGRIVTPATKITENGTPVFSIYSSYNSKTATDYGITLSGGINQGIDPVYASVYSPLAHINITSGARLSGSAIGKTVNVTGEAGILYDMALGDANIGGSDTGGGVIPGGGKPRIVFSGW